MPFDCFFPLASFHYFVTMTLNTANTGIIHHYTYRKPYVINHTLSTGHEVIAMVFTRSISRCEDRERPIFYHGPSNFNGIPNLWSNCWYTEPFSCKWDCNCNIRTGASRPLRCQTNKSLGTNTYLKSHIFSFESERYFTAVKLKQFIEKALKPVAFAPIFGVGSANWALIASTLHTHIQPQSHILFAGRCISFRTGHLLQKHQIPTRNRSSKNRPTMWIQRHFSVSNARNQFHKLSVCVVGRVNAILKRQCTVYHAICTYIPLAKRCKSMCASIRSYQNNHSAVNVTKRVQMCGVHNVKRSIARNAMWKPINSKERVSTIENVSTLKKSKMRRNCDILRQRPKSHFRANPNRKSSRKWKQRPSKWKRRKRAIQWTKQSHQKKEKSIQSRIRVEISRRSLKAVHIRWWSVLKRIEWASTQHRCIWVPHSIVSNDF